MKVVPNKGREKNMLKTQWLPWLSYDVITKMEKRGKNGRKLD